jgi:hypothetical protein
MTSLERVCVLALVSMGASIGIADAKRTPCPGGRFVIQGGPLLPGAPATEVDVLEIGGTPTEGDLGVGCTPADLVKPLRLRAGKRGTKLRAIWADCAGFTGKVRLTGLITDECGALDASLRAKRFKKTFGATLSRCGDDFVDAAIGEACETSAPCGGGAECGSACTCEAPTTTTTSTTTTTVPPGPCNPLAAPGAQGCPAGEKCTWIEVQDAPEPIGLVGCAPNGAQGAGDACSFGATGEATGFDDCAAGLICVAGTCSDVCGFDASPEAACAAGSTCTRYSNLFANGADDPVAGACRQSCDPLTQLQSTSGTPCGNGQGCYLLTSSTDTIGVCAGAGTLAHGQEITGPAFANSCLPGHQPRRRSPSDLVFECGALCGMVDVYSMTNEAAEGGQSPYTCESKGAAAPSDPMNGESCRYWWAREPFENPSAFSNTIGFCFKHAVYSYDSDGDMTPDAPFPRCITLTTGDVVPPIGNPPVSDALYFWCQAEPAPLTVSRSNVPPPVQRPALVDRMALHP